jgi:hypothetical protein
VAAPGKAEGKVRFLPASQRIVAISAWFARPYAFEVPIQKRTQGRRVPPGEASQPQKESPRRQYENTDDLSVEQDDSAKYEGRGGGEKGNHGAASQEQSPQRSINGSH